MGLPFALTALCGVLIVIAGVFLAIGIQRVVHNRNLMLEAERQRVRKRTAQKLLWLQAEKRKLRGS